MAFTIQALMGFIVSVFSPGYLFSQFNGKLKPAMMVQYQQI